MELASAAARPAEVDAPHWQRLAAARSADDYYAAWLALQCTLVDGIARGVLVLGAPGVGPYAPVSVWPAGENPSHELAEAAGRALETHAAVASLGPAAAVVAVPIMIDGQLHGVVALEGAPRHDEALRRLVEQVQWGLFGIESALHNQQAVIEQTTRERLVATLDLMASVLTEVGFERAAQALATDLATRLDCDRVSIGFVRDQHAEVLAVSHSAEFGERMNLIRAIAMAMDEALDQKSIVVLPPSPDVVLVTRDHAALARLHGCDNLLTIPFALEAGSLGAFCFERPAGRAFDVAAIELCQAVVALTSRVLEEKRCNERLLAVRIRDAAAGELRKFTGPRHFARKLAATAFMLLALFFAFATGQHRVGASASLEGAVRRVLVAPFDGYVATSLQRAGDVVKAGALLATLDDSDIRLEYFKWVSQRSQYAKQYADDMARHDRAQANIALAQMQQAEAQINLAAEQINRTQIAAPFDGLVVNGDLSQALGNSVKRGQVLFEVSPLNAYRVVLEVADGEIDGLALGQSGTLMLTALPDQVFPIKVTHLTPIVIAREGRSYFRVEALLERQSERLRPGMEGVAKIDVGQRKLFWIWTHKLFDWLRLSLWSWL